MKIFARLLCAVALIAVCGGCRSELSTTVELRADHTTSVVVTAVFEGDVAAVINGDTLDELRATWVDRAGIEPSVSRDSNTLRVTSSVPYDQLVAASTITGIGALSVTDHDDGTVTVEVVEVIPQLLIDTIVAAAANEPDPAQVTDLMLSRTEVTFEVTFGSDDISTTGPATVDGDAVSRTRTLDAPVAVSWSATGTWPTGTGAVLGVPTVVFVAGSVVLFAAGVWWVRFRARS